MMKRMSNTTEQVMMCKYSLTLSS